MNKDNLIKLRDHLENVVDPTTFSMNVFSSMSILSRPSDVDEANEINWCGTAACMVGHATALFPFEESEVRGKVILWVRYSERIFNIPQVGILWQFLFGACWNDSIIDAVNLINYVLEHESYPSNFDQWNDLGWAIVSSNPDDYFRVLDIL